MAALATAAAARRLVLNCAPVASASASASPVLLVGVVLLYELSLLLLLLGESSSPFSTPLGLPLPPLPPLVALPAVCPSGVRSSSSSPSPSPSSSFFFTKRPFTRTRLSAKFLRTSYLTFFVHMRRFRFSRKRWIRDFRSSGEYMPTKPLAAALAEPPRSWYFFKAKDRGSARVRNAPVLPPRIIQAASLRSNEGMLLLRMRDANFK
mmetsp:Transcript_20652/g.34574  ORF Transcript_20652/g.34574 Transcript_20652/m.34574 type:complete len:207 (+) Transcript_20652:599-1219(+)